MVDTPRKTNVAELEGYGMRRDTIMRMLHHNPDAGLPDLDETGGEALDITCDFSSKVLIIKKHL